MVEPTIPEDMTKEDKNRALQYLVFFKKKRCGRIKARGCVDGWPQRAYISNNKSSSPTVELGSFFISCVMDATEGQKVAMVSIPDAFMQIYQEGTVFVKLTGLMVRLLLKINPGKYEKHIRWFRGEEVLYIILKKALYGTLLGAMPFWKKLAKFIVEKMVFEINPYDWCVENKTINVKQCMILCHVDDLKISHEEDLVIIGIITNINK